MPLDPRVSIGLRTEDRRRLDNQPFCRAVAAAERRENSREGKEITVEDRCPKGAGVARL